MPKHPTATWVEGMDRSRLLAWAEAHASWSSDAWARDDAQSWTSAFTDDVIAHIRRRMGPESYRGVADLVERAWGLREFFPEDVVSVVDVRPPSVVLYRIEMRDELGNVVGIFIAHRLDGSGRIAEFVVYDDDAPVAEVEAAVTHLAERGRS
jgi:hypothetical protein